MNKLKYCNHEVALSITSYKNGVLCITLKEDAEEFSLTVDLTVGGMLPKNYSFVDTSKLPQAEKFIVENHLGVFTGLEKNCNGYTYPLYQFFPDIIREYCEHKSGKEEA